MGHIVATSKPNVKPVHKKTSITITKQIHQLVDLNGRFLDPVIVWGGKWYHFSKLVSWLHPGQMGRGRVRGLVILEALKKTDSLCLCLNLLHAPSIIGSGLVVYRRYFGDNTSLPLWGSANERLVPCVFRDMNKLDLGWYPINSFFTKDDPVIQVPRNALLEETVEQRCIEKDLWHLKHGYFWP